MAVNRGACLAECAAMALFVIIGCGTAMVTPERNTHAMYSSSPGWILMVALTFGLAITTLAYSIGHYSGGQINAAVTFGLVLAGACPANQGVANIVSQLVGSVIGAGILCSIFSKENDGTGGLGSNLVNPAYTQGNALIAETVGSFILMFVVLQTAVNPRTASNRRNACIAIGFAVFLAHMLLIHIDGCSINPTRSFGPAFVTSIFREDVGLTMGGMFLKDMWIFWVGPLVGAALAVVVYKALESRGAPKDRALVGEPQDAPSSASAEANWFTGIIAVVAYVYNFYVLVLMAPGFMINIGTIFPSLEKHFPYSMDYNESRVEGLGFKVFLDVLLAAFFVIPHSIFARPAAKAALDFGAAYRPLYTLMSAFQLHVLEIYWQPLTDSLAITFWDTTTSNLMYPLLAIYGLGYLWLVTSTFAIDHTELFGLKQGLGIDLYEMLGITSEDGLVRRCHYKVVRHPIMLGFFIMFFFVPSMTFTHLFFSVACTAYNVVGTLYLEEPDLRNELGQSYEDYSNEVPAFCPFAPVIGGKKRSAPADNDDSSEDTS